MVGVVIGTRAYLVTTPKKEILDRNLLTFALMPDAKKKAKVIEPIQKVEAEIKRQKNHKKPSRIIPATYMPTFKKKPGRYVSIENPKEIYYEIQEGDTLQKISLNFYGTTKKYLLLSKANPNVNPSNLKLGERIKIPNLKLSETMKKPEVLLHYQNENKRPYTIKENDVLSIIAEKELGSSKKVKKILEVNPGLKANRLRVGQKIFIPTTYKPRSQ
jgi:nucleoid-associated protein YgaU